MWRRLKMWLGWHHSAQLLRLDAASAANLTAQRKLQEAGDDAASSAAAARKQAIMARWEARKAARRLRAQPMQTGYVRELVEEMLSDMDHRADHRAQHRH